MALGSFFLPLQGISHLNCTLGLVSVKMKEAIRSQVLEPGICRAPMVPLLFQESMEAHAQTVPPRISAYQQTVMVPSLLSLPSMLS
jgi:hypothetical protein